MTPPTGNAAPSQRITFSNRPIHCIFTPALINDVEQNDQGEIRLPLKVPGDCDLMAVKVEFERPA